MDAVKTSVLSADMREVQTGAHPAKVCRGRHGPPSAARQRPKRSAWHCFCCPSAGSPPKLALLHVMLTLVSR